MPKSRHIATAVLLAAIVPTFACASAPTRQLSDTKAALRAAEEMNGQENPKAAYHLKLAQDQIAAAEKLIDGGDGDNDEMRDARRYLERAEADAELAIAYARTTELRTDAQRAWNEVETLRGTTAE
jgi:hypothetical protein